MSDKWKKVKTNGHFKRKIQKKFFTILITAVETTQHHNVINETPVVRTNPIQSDVPNQLPVNWTPSPKAEYAEFSPNLPQYDEAPQVSNEGVSNEHLYTELQKWAISFNIRQNAWKELMLIVNNRLPNVFPIGPRTFV